MVLNACFTQIFPIAVFAGLLMCGLANAAPPVISRFEVAPTVLFVRENGELCQVLNAAIENGGKAVDGRIVMRVKEKETVFPLGNIAPGAKTYTLHIPELKEPASATFTLRAGGETKKCEAALSPHRKWTIYLFHHSHSDIGYTELQSRITSNHVAYLDSVIEYCRQTDSYPDDAKFRWNVEITWSLQNYMAQRPESKVRELMDLVKAGRVEVTAWYLNMSDGFSHEELIRNAYLAREISNKYGVEIISAMNNDVNGFGWGVPQVLSRSGVKYFNTGINETRSLAPLDRPCAFRWEAADGSKVLHWNGEHYLYANGDLLIHEGADTCAPKVSAYLDRLEKRGDYPYDITAMNIGAWLTDNCPPGRGLSDVIREWNTRYEYPKLRLALIHEYFEELEKRYGEKIPTYKLGWPDYWTDGVGSTAFETGLNRAAHSDLISAEKVNALASGVDPGFIYPSKDINDTYDQSMLYDEHTWGAYNSISEPWSELARGQWAIKSAYAYRAREQSRTLLNRGMAMLARNIPADGEFLFAVFNPLSWERTDLARISLPQPLIDRNGAFMLTDLRTGKDVPFQVLDRSTLLFTARDVPSLGYAVFAVRTEGAAPRKADAPGANGVLENRFYRVTLDPVTGGITSIYDKELNAELADSANPYRLNQYVYENPVGGRAAVDNMKERAKFNRYSPSSATFDTVAAGPAQRSLTARTTAKPCPVITQQVILPEDVKRIDIVNTITKDEVLDSEAIYWAFPFAVPGGKFRIEVADGAMCPETEQLPKTTRDWMAVQNWVEIAGKDYSVVWSPLEAPLVQFCDINTGKWLRKLEFPNAALFSYAMNNYWMTNFKAGQGGMVTFRYSITSRKGGADDLASSRFGWECQTPFDMVWLSKGSRGKLSGSGQQLFNMNAPNVIVQTVKRAEDGRGLIVRLRELSGKDTDVRFSSPVFPTGAKGMQTDIAERDIHPFQSTGGEFTVPVKAYAIETVRIVTK